MIGKQVTLTTAQALVDGSNGTVDKPVTVAIRPETGTIWLGGNATVDATHGLGLKSTDQPLVLRLIGEVLWGFAASSIVVDLLFDGS